MTDERDLSPEDVLADLKRGDALLVDVREPAEFAYERIHGALLHPLSTFEAKAIPTDGHRRVIFQCGSGKRSRKALDTYMKSTGGDGAHLAGGLGAWKQAGLPSIRIDPSTGNVIDSGKY